MKPLIKRVLKATGLWERLRELENTYRRKKITNDSQQEWSDRAVSFRETYELPPVPKPTYKHVFFLVVDCLRADHVGFCGYEKRETTPFLDELANDSLVSCQHFSTSSWTYPTVTSLLTGLYPHEHGGVLPQQKKRRFYHDSNNIPQRPNDDAVFLTDYLGSFDYHTYCDASVLTAGLALQGRFESLISRDAQADEVFNALKTKIQKHENIFGYVQLGDLHEPLEILNEDYRPFGEITYDNKDNMMRWRYTNGRQLQTEQFAAFKENRELLYDTALRYVDEQIEGFFRWLHEEDLLQDTLVVVTADHGEEFWEHIEFEKKYHEDPRGYYGIGHGHTLFNELIKVPFLMYAPKGIACSTSISSHVDVLPTVLHALGIDAVTDLPGTAMQASDGSQIIFAEEVGYGDEIKIATDGDQKFIIILSKKSGFLHLLQRIQQRLNYKNAPRVMI